MLFRSSGRRVCAAAHRARGRRGDNRAGAARASRSKRSFHVPFMPRPASDARRRRSGRFHRCAGAVTRLFLRRTLGRAQFHLQGRRVLLQHAAGHLVFRQCRLPVRQRARRAAFGPRPLAHQRDRRGGAAARLQRLTGSRFRRFAGDRAGRATAVAAAASTRSDSAIGRAHV